MAQPALDPSKPILLTPDTPQVDTLVDGIMHLHAHCILFDGTMATFLPPLSRAKLLKYWQGRLNQVTEGRRHIIVYLLPVSSRTTTAPDPVYAADDSAPVTAPAITLNQVDYEIAGMVSLHEPESETGPNRGEVEKLFTSPNHRRKGVARIVMRELERVARLDGRWSLILDTGVGWDAAVVYPKLGYIEMGVVKAHGISPVDGRYVDELWLWKDIRETPEL